MVLHPTRSQFRAQCRSRVADGGPARVVPVWREMLEDTQTPVSVFARMRDFAPAPFLLESVVGGERWGRYSFIGVGHRFRVTGRFDDGDVRLTVTAGPGFAAPAKVPDGIAGIRELLRRYRGLADPRLPRFWGGLVGVFGHDLVRCVERLPRPRPADVDDPPAIDLLATDTLVIFDNVSGMVRIVAAACPDDDGGVDAAYDAAAARIADVERCLRGPSPARARPLPLWDPPEPQARSRFGGAGYPAAVQDARRHIRDGDIFQVVLSQAFDEPGRGIDPLDVYRLLRMANPSPYLYQLELPPRTLVGASPEVLVRVDRDDRTVTVRPIAGTRPRGADEAEDQAFERELLADPKERAEHLMLVDLGRNDVGRVAAAGTVQVGDLFVIERYSRVMHIVSEVVGRLEPGLDAIDALLATFPAGTLSGAPKVRALEIIDALEPHDRGWYGGAVGYLGYDGGADLAICIRSLVVSDDRIRVQAGAGIVYDSDPQAEDHECRRKASAVLRAVAVARGEPQPPGPSTEEPT